MTYNLHSLKYTYLKYTGYEFWKICILEWPSTRSRWRTFSITPENSFMPFSSLYLSNPPAPCLNHYSNFYHHRFGLSVFELSINDSIRCVLIKPCFTQHIFSFIHIVVCSSSLFFVLLSSISHGKYTIVCLSILLLMDVWVPGLIPYELWRYEHFSSSFFVNLWIYFCYMYMFIFIRNSQKLLQNVCTILHSHQQYIWILVPEHSS